MSLAVLRPLAFGEVLDHAFGLYRKLFASLLILSVITNALPVLLSLAATMKGGIQGAPGLWGLSVILSLVGGSIGTAASTFLVAGHLLGASVTPGDALKRATPKFLAVLLCSLLLGLVVGLGFVLLIVPGIIAACGLVLSLTAIVMEDLGPTDALGRSWELTKDFRMRIFGLFAIFAIVIYIVIIGIGIAAAIVIPAGGAHLAESMAAGTVPTFVIMVAAVTSLVQLILYPLLYCILVVEYYDLRVRKEGFDLELLATTMERPAAT